MENRRKHKLILLILLTISTVLQFLCLVTPGWTIVKTRSKTTYSGIFYETECIKVTDKCETLSYYDKLAHGTGIYRYSYVVRTNIFMLVTIATTALCLVVQLYSLSRKIVAWMVLSFSCLMTMASSFMISHLSIIYVSLSTHLDMSEGSSVTMGFPYCVLLYTFAFLLNSLVVFLMIWEFYKYQQGQAINGQQHGTEGIVLATHNTAEMDPILPPGAKST